MRMVSSTRCATLPLRFRRVEDKTLVQPPMLCDTCRSIVDQILDAYRDPTWEDPPEFDHHETFEDLEEAAKLSCYVCNLVSNDIKRIWPDFGETVAGSAPPLLMVAVRSEPEGYEITFHLSYHLYTLELDGYRRELTDFLLETLKEEQEERIEISNSTDITGTETILLSWLKHCLENHTECAKTRNEKWYPNRLLDLSHASSIDGGIVQLVETTAKVMNGPYITLSHCWGGEIAMKLTKNRLDDFVRGVSVTDLPKTFYDAISVAQCLSVRYLWIDAMVIIQDSTTDWTEESSLMSQVYQNALCNVGAAASMNSSGGLFFDRNPELIRPPHITIDQHKYRFFYASCWKALDIAPLNQRGWVHQERWLCQRMLHFTSQQLFWECRGMTVCESRPQNQDWMFHASVKREQCLLAAGGDGLQQIPERERISRLYAMWGTFIRAYSEAHLTYVSDKLVAISGVANAFHEELKDEYLAGHWKRFLIIELAWSVYDECKGRTKNYIAPSWSWASIDGQILSSTPLIYGDPKVHETCTLIGHKIDLTTTNPTGQVNSGSLQVRGPIRAVSVDYSYSQRMKKINGWGEEHQVWMDFEDPNNSQDSILFFLALYKETECWGYYKTRVSGILLDPLLGSVSEFSRVGLVLLQFAEGQVETRTTPERVPSLDGVDFDIEHGYTVQII